jgi:hypothetical protein
MYRQQRRFSPQRIPNDAKVYDYFLLLCLLFFFLREQKKKAIYLARLTLYVQ